MQTYILEKKTNYERVQEIFKGAGANKTMTEAQAYQLAAQAMRCIEGLLEPHKAQQLADAIVAAIMSSCNQDKCTCKDSIGYNYCGNCGKPV